MYVQVACCSGAGQRAVAVAPPTSRINAIAMSQQSGCSDSDRLAPLQAEGAYSDVISWTAEQPAARLGGQPPPADHKPLVGADTFEQGLRDMAAEGELNLQRQHLISHLQQQPQPKQHHQEQRRVREAPGACP